jgi:DNA invertase Pin-like site-specific DNA recombinase
MIYGYIRISTYEQSIESQKNIISRYCMDHKFVIDEWIALEISSRKSLIQRRIEELLDKLLPGDTVIISEISRLGRSIKETLNIIAAIINHKCSRLICVKQNLDLDPLNQNDIANKILITVFSMIAELERDFISERTKEGLRARVAKGIKLGKPKGLLQNSMYDKDQQKIFELYKMGVPLHKIISLHLGYGKYLSLKIYINKRCKIPLRPPRE